MPSLTHARNAVIVKKKFKKKIPLFRILLLTYGLNNLRIALILESVKNIVT